MKRKQLGLAMVLALACLVAASCVTSGEGDDNGDVKVPNFIQDSSSGGPRFEEIKAAGVVTGIRFFSYVKNIGDAGRISMSIASTIGSASKQFDVAAGTSYVFQASVPAMVSSTKSFTYSAKFPGSPGYTDSQAMSGYDCTGVPFDLQMNAK